MNAARTLLLSILIFIILAVGALAIIYISEQSASCPANQINSENGQCCNDFNNNGICDVAEYLQKNQQQLSSQAANPLPIVKPCPSLPAYSIANQKIMESNRLKFEGRQRLADEQKALEQSRKNWVRLIDGKQVFGYDPRYDPVIDPSVANKCEGTGC